MMGLLDQLNEVLLQTPRKYWGDKATRLGSLLGDAASTGAQAYGSANSPMAPEYSQTLAGLLADFTPVVGDVKSAYDGMNAAREGDYLGAALGGLGALPLVPNLAGMFIGKGAKTWDAVNASRAMEMEQAGIDPRKIWSETGNWKGPDGHWRQEIPDNAARVNENKPIGANEWMENDIPNVPGTNPVGKVFDSKHGGGLLYHPELPNAYNPSDIATNANVIGSNSLLRSERGAFDPETKNISIFGGLNANEARSTMLHELQHAIQTKEGWAKGGSPASIAQDQARAKARISFLNSELSQAAKDLDRFKKGTPEYASARETYDAAMNEKLNISPSLFQSDSYDGYRLLSGEAEARATQARMSMDAAQRRATFPADSYDVPLSSLIVKR